MIAGVFGPVFFYVHLRERARRRRQLESARAAAAIRAAEWQAMLSHCRHADDLGLLRDFNGARKNAQRLTDRARRVSNRDFDDPRGWSLGAGWIYVVPAKSDAYARKAPPDLYSRFDQIFSRYRYRTTRDREETVFKIGFTTRDPDVRIAELNDPKKRGVYEGWLFNSDFHVRYRVDTYVEGLEREIHRQLASKRVFNELFLVSLRELDEVVCRVTHSSGDVHFPLFGEGSVRVSTDYQRTTDASPIAIGGPDNGK